MEEAVLITNPAAEATSEHVKEVIVKALSSDLRLEVVDTAAPGHATRVASEAVRNGCGLVVAFGGDGTMSEVANGMVGSDTPLAILPGGNANVVCRNLGLPADIVEATGRLLNGLREHTTRRISVGRTGGRCFLVSCGLGLRPRGTHDAEHDAGHDVERYPGDSAGRRTGLRLPGRHLLEAAFRAAVRDHRGRETRIHLSAGDAAEDVVVALITNMSQLSYVGDHPVTLAPEARLDEGLDVLAMRTFPLAYVPRLAWSALSGGSHVHFKQVLYLHDLGGVRATSAGGPFSVHLDGEFVEDRTEVEVELIRNGLAVLV
jgi:diacylglycerol kinase family enzyme